MAGQTSSSSVEDAILAQSTVSTASPALSTTCQPATPWQLTPSRQGAPCPLIVQVRVRLRPVVRLGAEVHRVPELKVLWRAGHQEFNLLPCRGDEGNCQAAIKVVGPRLVDLQDAVQGLQETTDVRRSTFSDPIDEYTCKKRMPKLLAKLVIFDL